jgi:rod shape-determining protein MreD
MRHPAMTGLSNILVLATAYLVVYLEVSFNGLRAWAGGQLDLLPSLVVYVGLTHGPATLALLTVGGGLLFDSMSANPLGVSILPLFVVGFILLQYRGLLLRDQPFAQWVLGFGASAAAPALTVLLLVNMDRQPLLSWFSFWQWMIMGLLGAAATPLWFGFFDCVNRTLNYRPLDSAVFRPDREIKRGR